MYTRCLKNLDFCFQRTISGVDFRDEALKDSGGALYPYDSHLPGLDDSQ